ncbi:MAG TPA: ShlB/FhaC/HecB family hemolysin secretion/activation protein [Chthoniobacteraceae bacterium]|nr:ShlB/FhaC/HecB family hemolysin secretion/activation protein [Chthoniobacteraceae bacterium]
MAALLAVGGMRGEAAQSAQPATSGTGAGAQQTAKGKAGAQPQAQAPEPEFYIREYRVRGTHHLSPIDVQRAVYPFLGPGRTAADVNSAREALQKAYETKNYTAVNVTVPPQTGAGGVVFLQVDENPVGRLRVHGSRYYDINDIKRAVPSLAEGNIVNFSQVQKEMVGINQLPDRRVTPSIQAGAAPGTMDVDLNVKDTLPLHGSVELNNRYSADTPPLRLNASVSYDNLWQAGNSIGGSVQVSPQNVSKVNVYTGFYTLRFPNVDWLSFTLQGTKQNSNVSTLGSIDVTGRGDIIGLNTNFKLPTMGDYFQNFTFGIAYKEFDQNVEIGVPGTTTTATETPTTYLPLTLDYSGTRVDPSSLTDLDLQVVLNLRGIGSNATQFTNNRYGADRNFIYFRGDTSRTQDIWGGAQLYAKVGGQVSDSPLINSEQFSVGGLGTVRGYLESEVLGDDAVIFNFEARTPSLLSWIKGIDPNKPSDEWRFYFFTDAGAASIQDPLPDQTERYSLASYGGGTRLTLLNHFNGSLDLAIPLFTQVNTKAHNPFLTFRVWTDF